MAEDQRVYLDDIYASEQCQGSVFRAVVMMAQEARFINKQAVQGYIQLKKKPTTIAMYKFKEGKLTMTERKPGEYVEEDNVAVADMPEEPQMTAENAAKVSADADNAFGV